MNQTQTKMETIRYDDGVVRAFVIATAVWAIVAMLVGVLVASQLAHWKMNLGLPWLTFGRLRPLHTNAAIFAFAGNAVFAGIYYSSQRLLKTRMLSDALSWAHFWGWQLIIVSAALTLPFGITMGKEYAELEWPIDIAITLVWVIFAVNFFGALFKRRERHIYVAIWFYIATIVTVAVLHIINSIEIPVSLFKSYPIYAGAQDALVQWWYGHNAVAFFLTTPFLGLMYYFLPKAANRPVYSYRLSIIHFWSLVFLYIWAGPHHLLNSSVPDWAQTLGMIFSVMLIAPSWGGMINGLLTLRGAWQKVREEPILKFFVAGITFYGMSTFEGPMLSIKGVNALTHYTDYIIGHVHGGALGWNGFLAFGMIYYLLPKLWKKEVYSKQLSNVHFWMGLFGIVGYMSSMWAAGLTQGLMWRAVDATGKLVYPDFVETVIRIVPLYWIRLLSGLLYFGGTCVGVFNIFKTIAAAPKGLTDEEVQVASMAPKAAKETPHRMIEGLPAVFSVLVVLAILVGTVIEIVPSFLAQEYVDVNPVMANGQRKIKPYTALELAGRDIYIREGCYLCHSQMIRPLEGDVLRYGTYTRIEETMYDHPFQWGSRRIGPDLARVGGKYPDLWHYRHMMDPRAVTEGSIMPTYPWLYSDKTDFDILPKKLSVMKTVGVPYSDAEIENAAKDARTQAASIAAGLEQAGLKEKAENLEITALIAYLQRLGADFKKAQQ